MLLYCYLEEEIILHLRKNRERAIHFLLGSYFDRVHSSRLRDFFRKRSKIYSMSLQEVQGNPNIIKIILSSLNHLMTTTAARASHRHAPLLESA
jgi:hypothetical protein